MFPTQLIRLTQAAMLAAIVAVFVPNVAQTKPLAMPGVKLQSSSSTVVLDGRSPDTRDAAYDTQFQVVDGRSPDTLDAAGNARAAQLQLVDGRSPDTLDAARNGQNAQLQVLDGRSPDTIDAAQTIQPIELPSSNGFDWSDAEIGAAGGAGLILLMGASMLLVVRTLRRHDVHAT